MMSRKIFISFLGTNDYVECNYFEEGDKRRKAENVKYIQEALVKLYCGGFTKGDELIFCLTEEAKNKNWISDKGLKERLDDLNLDANITPIDIRKGLSENEIWDIFDTIIRLVKPNDELWLDITHGFRSLPMLAMVLTNFLKTTMNVEVKAIFYGAFEVLGPAFKVKELDIVDRNAPIINLISFSKLQDWTSAANMFLETGRASYLNDLASKDIKDVLKASKGTDKLANKIRSIGKQLDNFTSAIATNRGNQIYSGKEISQLKYNLSELGKVQNIEKKYIPFLSLVNKAADEFKEIKENSSNNWFYVSKWCLKNKLIQQGITIFREGIVTHILNFINENYNRTLDYDTITDRDLCEALMFSSNPKVKIEDYKKTVLKNLDLLQKLEKDSIFMDVSKLYNSSLAMRNDINHSGYGKSNNRKADDFTKKLNELIEKFEPILKTTPHTQNPNLLHRDKMFINISNHPSSKWEEKQISIAKEYGAILDIPFPQIDPAATSEQVKDLAMSYFDEIQNIVKSDSSPIVVHIMGEMTFVFALVQMLQKQDIECVASTSERLVTEEQNGRKVVQFNFVQFRAYSKF